MNIEQPLMARRQVVFDSLQNYQSKQGQTFTTNQDKGTMSFKTRLEKFRILASGRGIVMISALVFLSCSSPFFLISLSVPLLVISFLALKLELNRNSYKALSLVYLFLLVGFGYGLPIYFISSIPPFLLPVCLAIVTVSMFSYIEKMKFRLVLVLMNVGLFFILPLIHPKISTGWEEALAFGLFVTPWLSGNLIRLPTFNQEYIQDKVDFEHIMESMDEGVMFVDNAGKCVYANQKWMEFTGYSTDELLGVDVGELLLSKSDQEFLKSQFDERQAGRSNRYEIRIITKSGRLKWILNIGTPLFNVKGEVIGSIGIMTDITEKKEMLEKMESYNKLVSRSNEELKQINKELEQYAYVASHDLKSPLRSIASFASLLKRRYAHQLDDEAQEFIHYITKGCKDMSELVEGLLNYATHSQKPEIKEVSLSGLMQRVKMDMVEALASSNGVVIADDLPVINGNYLQIQRLFRNLIENAIKYRREDVRPIINIRMVDQEDDMITIAVSDNGIGMKKNYSDRIFRMFSQLNPSYEGIGMGLAICKKIMDNHQGRIEVESAPGLGTVFYLKFPKSHISISEVA